MIFKKLASFFILALLVGCEFNDGGDSGSGSAGASDDGALSAEVEGRAVKGILSHMVVQAYALENGELRWIGETVTDNEGNYALKLEGISGPVLIEVTPGTKGSMRCDLPDGCGVAAFGEDVAIPAGGDFRLSTVVRAEELGNAEVAITPVTHLAAEWVRALPAGVTASSVTFARDRVASLLHVSPDFAFQRVPDITDQTELSDADFNALGHAVMSLAVADLGEGLVNQEQQKALVQRFINHGGQVPISSDGIDLTSIYASAASKARSLKGSSHFAGMAEAFEFYGRNMGRGISGARGRGHVGDQPMTVARAFVADLDEKFSAMGITADGGFTAMQTDRYGYLASPGMVRTAGIMRQSLGFAVLMGLVGEYYTEQYGNPAVFGHPDDIQITYDHDIRTLTVTSPVAGETASIVVSVPDIDERLAAQQQVVFGMQADVSNQDVNLSFDGKAWLSPEDTDFMPVIMAGINMTVAGGSGSYQNFIKELGQLMINLDVGLGLEGKGHLVPADGHHRGFRGGLRATMRMDTPDMLAGREFFRMRIRQADIVGPVEDVVYSPDGGEQLRVSIGRDLRIEFDTRLAAAGVPETGLAGHVEMLNMGHNIRADIVSYMKAGLMDYVPPALAEVDIVKRLVSPAMHFSMALPGDGRSYDVRFADGVLALRRSDWDGQEVRVNFLSDGGLLYVGDDLVGTVSQSGIGEIAVYLADGSRHLYQL